MTEDFVITSDDKRVRLVVEGLEYALTRALAVGEVEGEMQHPIAAMAVTHFVWRLHTRNTRIPTTVISALMNMAVDAGMGEQIGMVQMAEPGERLQ
jgi:hypothetical protein